MLEIKGLCYQVDGEREGELDILRDINLTVEDNNGTVRVRRYGDTVTLGEALALEFTANKATSSTVTLTAAKFDLDANSINFDAPETTITDADTVVDANNFTVTLPEQLPLSDLDLTALLGNALDNATEAAVRGAGL